MNIIQRYDVVAPHAGTLVLMGALLRIRRATRF
jgi:hypothetical protein